MANNLNELSELTLKISNSFEKLEMAKKKEDIKKEILEMQKKRGQLITKLKTELTK
jgi:hypothetical protein